MADLSADAFGGGAAGLSAVDLRTAPFQIDYGDERLRARQTDGADLEKLLPLLGSATGNMPSEPIEITYAMYPSIYGALEEIVAPGNMFSPDSIVFMPNSARSRSSFVKSGNGPYHIDDETITRQVFVAVGQGASKPVMDTFRKVDGVIVHDAPFISERNAGGLFVVNFKKSGFARKPQERTFFKTEGLPLETISPYNVDAANAIVVDATYATVPMWAINSENKLETAQENLESVDAFTTSPGDEAQKPGLKERMIARVAENLVGARQPLTGMTFSVAAANKLMLAAASTQKKITDMDLQNEVLGTDGMSTDTKMAIIDGINMTTSMLMAPEGVAKVTKWGTVKAAINRLADNSALTKNTVTADIVSGPDFPFQGIVQRALREIQKDDRYSESAARFFLTNAQNIRPLTRAVVYYNLVFEPGFEYPSGNAGDQRKMIISNKGTKHGKYSKDGLFGAFARAMKQKLDMGFRPNMYPQPYLARFILAQELKAEYLRPFASAPNQTRAGFADRCGIPSARSLAVAGPGRFTDRVIGTASAL